MLLVPAMESKRLKTWRGMCDQLRTLKASVVSILGMAYPAYLHKLLPVDKDVKAGIESKIHDGQMALEELASQGQKLEISRKRLMEEKKDAKAEQVDSYQ